MLATLAPALKKLSPEERRQFDTAGYVFPVPILSDQEVAVYREHLRNFLAGPDWPITTRSRNKPHLYLKWVGDLVRHPVLLDAVEDILGPNLLIWQCRLYFKPTTTVVVPWHCDTQFGELSGDEVVSAWIALTHSRPENGGLQFEPGSHLRNAEITRRGALPSGPAVGIDVVLRPGEASLHDVRTTHRSGANRTAEPRCGIVVRYIPARLRPCRRGAAATLVRGTVPDDRFALEPAPRFDRDPVALVWHSRALRERRREILRSVLRNPRDRFVVTLKFLREKLRQGRGQSVLEGADRGSSGEP